MLDRNTPDGAHVLEDLTDETGDTVDTMLTVLQLDGSIDLVQAGEASTSDIEGHIRYREALVEADEAEIARLKQIIDDKLNKRDF